MTLPGILRAAYPKALSTLVRIVGSLHLAEDVLQDAVAKALIRWQDDGVPESPEAWLVRTARNQAIDGFRRNALEKRHIESTLQHLEPDALPTEIGLRDDMLRLIFTCCHPVLGREAQVALTLKAIAGLSIEEIASGFLVAPRAIEQRITRAKKRIREACVAYEVPSHKDLQERLTSVLAVVHLIFNEGYSASIDAPLIRHQLCQLAIELAQQLCDLFPDESEVGGLYALLLLSHSRAGARMESNGMLVPLDRQDRSRWNRQAIAKGVALLETALSRGHPGTYQIQAAISATHCRAQCWQDTDWREVVRLYDALWQRAPSPVVQLNRAVAVSKAEGAEVGLALVDVLVKDTTMAMRHGVHAVRAGLLEELKRWPEALESYQNALTRTKNSSEISYLEDKINEIKKR